MSRTQVYVYKGFERFWHWMQALLILFLALTGFEIHGSLAFLGFEQAVRYHRYAAFALMVLIAFAAFWHLTTGEWRQYLPTVRHLRAHADYYLVGVFRGAPHPTRRTVLSKLNPLQKIVYLPLKLLVIPVMVVTGTLYMLYRYPQRYGIEAMSVSGLQTIAVVHTAGAFFLVAFIVAHVYLITTGTTLTSNLRAMITGYEELDDVQPAPDARQTVSTSAQASADRRINKGMTMRSDYMNPYLAGLLLGLLLLLTIFLTGRGLGASGAYRSTLTAAVEIVSPAHASGNAFYGHTPAGTSPLKVWLVFEVLGVVIGAFVSGVASNRLALFTERPPHVRASRRLLGALVGGALFGIGAQFARGCTSGAALSGMAVMSFGGILTMFAIFGSAYAVAFFVRRLWIPAPEASHGPARS